jgi:hypothetical protein
VIEVSDEITQITELLSGELEKKEDDIEPVELSSGAADGQADLDKEETVDKDEDKGDLADEEVTWAKVLGVDDSRIEVDDKGNVKGLKVIVDGEESLVPVKDLIDGFQLNKHVTQKSMALSEEKKYFDQLKMTASAAYLEKLETVDKLSGLIQQSLLKEYNSVDWGKLRAENPAEYAALYTDFQTRASQVSGLMEAINAERYENQAKLNEEAQAGYQQHLQVQYAKVLENNPAWSDHAKMKSDVETIASFVQNAYGISPQEFSMLNDARHIEILKDAMAYRNGKQKVEQQVKTVPKFQRQNQTGSAKTNLERLISKAKKSTGVAKRSAQTDAVVALLNQ